MRISPPTGTYSLLSNASATGSWQQVSGASYSWDAAGTLGGATLQLQTLGPDSSTAIDVDGATLTAAGSLSVDVGDGTSVRVAVSGGSPSGLYSTLRAL